MPTRYNDAVQIVENSRSIAALTDELQKAINECREESTHGVLPENDAAVRLIIYQMAHIANVAGANPREVALIKRACETMAEPFQKRLERFDRVALHGPFKMFSAWAPNEHSMTIDFSDFIRSVEDDSTLRGMSGVIDLSKDEVVEVRIFACTIGRGLVWTPTNCGFAGPAREHGKTFVKWLERTLTGLTGDRIEITVTDDPDLI